MKQEHITPEMSELILIVTDAQKKDEKLSEKNPDTPIKKWVRHIRRNIRYRLFRIRKNSQEHDKGLKKWMELQFREGMTWATFTFNWDVSANDPLKLIEQLEWDGELLFDPNTKKKTCDPAAFTHQEI